MTFLFWKMQMHLADTWLEEYICLCQRDLHLPWVDWFECQVPLKHSSYLLPSFQWCLEGHESFHWIPLFLWCIDGTESCRDLSMPCLICSQGKISLKFLLPFHRLHPSLLLIGHVASVVHLCNHWKYNLNSKGENKFNIYSQTLPLRWALSLQVIKDMNHRSPSIRTIVFRAQCHCWKWWCSDRINHQFFSIWKFFPCYVKSKNIL